MEQIINPPFFTKKKNTEKVTSCGSKKELTIDVRVNAA